MTRDHPVAAPPRARFGELRGRLLPLLGEVCGGNVTDRADLVFTRDALDLEAVVAMMEA